MSGLPAHAVVPIVLGCLALAAPAVSLEPDPTSPSFLLIVADDLGHGDLEFTGARDISTPHIDELARSGIHFSNAYANAPVCTPSRLALLTGQYQQRSGIDRVIYVNERGEHLPEDLILLPAILEASGYATGLVGKWHLGFDVDSFPTRRGFGEFAGFLAGNIDYYTHTDQDGRPDLWRDERQITDERYFTHFVADESIEFLRRHHEDPFFLFVSFSAPHSPFQGPESAERSRTRAVYASMVEELDAAVGRVLAELERLGASSRTVVFFTSDNGGIAGVANNAPFRGSKGSLWEGGVRVPLFVSWRGRIEAGAASPAVVAGMDLFPTILRLAEVAPPTEHVADGVDLSPILLSGASKHDRRSLHFCYRSATDAREKTQHALIQGPWKYLSDSGGVEHLYRLAEDPAEQSDISSLHPELMEQLRREAHTWVDSVSTRATDALPVWRAR